MGEVGVVLEVGEGGESAGDDGGGLIVGAGAAQDDLAQEGFDGGGEVPGGNAVCGGGEEEEADGGALGFDRAAPGDGFEDAKVLEDGEAGSGEGGVTPLGQEESYSGEEGRRLRGGPVRG